MDTIELLEAIGRDASLRHASAATLAGVLERARASEALAAAAASGDGTHLIREFGHKPMQAPQVIQTPIPAHEDDAPEREDDEPPGPAAPDRH